VLIPGWGCYLFELVLEELTPVRVSARTNPFPACCYCCCCRCSVLHPVPGDVLVASLTLMLTACVHAGCLCFRNREGRFNNVKNESGLLLEFHFHMDSVEYEVYCHGEPACGQVHGRCR